MKKAIKFTVGTKYFIPVASDEKTSILEVVSRTEKTVSLAVVSLGHGMTESTNDTLIRHIKIENNVEFVDGKNFLRKLYASSVFTENPPVKAVSTLDIIKAKSRIDENGKVKICFNGKFSAAQMFELLDNNGVNFETSYGILLRAVMFGEAKISEAKNVNNGGHWKDIPVFAPKWASHQMAKVNLKNVAKAVISGELVSKYYNTAVTTIDIVNNLIGKKFNIQKHAPKNDNAAKDEKAKTPKTPKNEKTPATNNDTEPIEVTIKAKTVAEAMVQKAEIDKLGGNFKVTIELVTF